MGRTRGQLKVFYASNASNSLKKVKGFGSGNLIELYEKFKGRLNDPAVFSGDFRGWAEREIEEQTKNIWDTIVDPRDDELLRLTSVVNHLRERTSGLRKRKQSFRGFCTSNDIKSKRFCRSRENDQQQEQIIPH